MDWVKRVLVVVEEDGLKVVKLPIVGVAIVVIIYCIGFKRRRLGKKMGFCIDRCAFAVYSLCLCVCGLSFDCYTHNLRVSPLNVCNSG